MKKTIDSLKLDYYHEELENGLNVFIVPMPFKNIYATFSTNYGSKENTFIPLNGEKEITVPDGIAHFLEHKLFETEDGLDPFKFFSKNQADCNANTSYRKTTYLFYGPKHLKENLEYLLNYVQSPFFTNENVLKEKGIIEQEIKMYDDMPSSVLFDKIIFNTFKIDPFGIPIIGSLDSIYKIEKEDLDTCYKTFYHPSNMFVVITGNVDPKDAIELIKENQKNKDYQKEELPKIKKYDEPDEVLMEFEEITKNIEIPIVGISYKIRKKGSETFRQTLLMYFSIIFSNMRKEVIDLIDEEVAIGGINFMLLESETHYIFLIESESKNPQKLVEFIKNQVNKKEISEEEFIIDKRTTYASSIRKKDDIFRMNSQFMDQYNRNREIIDEAKVLEEMTYEEFIKDINHINFSNNATIIIK